MLTIKREIEGSRATYPVTTTIAVTVEETGVSELILSTLDEYGGGIQSLRMKPVKVIGDTVTVLTQLMALKGLIDEIIPVVDQETK
jgi:hypothetical protein